MDRSHILQNFINKNDYKSYLEIGVDSGWLFKKINIPLKESVDPAKGQYASAKPTYKITSDEFFKTYKDKKYDIIFIDGLHESHQVDKDIKNSINVLNEGGKIVMHDCSPSTKRAETVPRPGPGVWNGDVWKSFVKFNYHNHQDYNCYVIDTDQGVGVIEKGVGQCDYQLPKELEYEWLVENRKQALNLISKDEFSRRIS
jgi:hypothetical protein